MFNSFREQYKNISFCKRSFVLNRSNVFIFPMNNCDGESHRQWSICCSWHGSGFGICYVQYSLSIEGGLSGKWRKINKSKCLTQNTSQWNVLLTSFKVLLFHIRCQWFSRWFGLWFQGNKLIQGKNLRGSFVNVLNLSLSAGNIFKASIGMI